MSNKKNKNESNAIDAFIKILREIKGVQYGKKCFPEKENRNTQDVEVILAPIDNRGELPEIAVEHTIVEAHEKQKDYVHQLEGIEKEITEKCNGKLPTDYWFTLSAPQSLIVGMNRKQRSQFVDEISLWILNVAKSLTTDKRISRLYNGHEVELWCGGSCSEFNGTVGTIQIRPDDSKIKKRDRFFRAIKEKLPKLIQYKEKEKKYLTALLLEDISASHTNLNINWKELIPDNICSEFLLKIDYLVIFISYEEKMFRGSVWKEESQLYTEIPKNRMFKW